MKGHSDAYDAAIRTAAEKHLPWIDWRLLKAQLITESGLDPTAKNEASGALGIAQFLPGTWKQIAKELGFPDASPMSARHAIVGAAYYDGKLWKYWSKPRPDADRISLAFAGYNAGNLYVQKAQNAAGGANDYAGIIARIGEVTNRNKAAEVVEYVRRIWGTFGELVTG